MRSTLFSDSGKRLREAPLSDQAMQQQIRALALTISPDSRAPLRFPSSDALRAPFRAAQSLPKEPPAACAGLQWLLENGRLAEALLLSLRRAARIQLPACKGLARILLFARSLTRSSDTPISPERLSGCLIAFDEVRSLTMNEIRLAPDALALALSEEYLRLADFAAQAQKSRLEAHRWLEAGAQISPALAKQENAFFEYALEALRARNLGTELGALKDWLANQYRDADQIIALERERQAVAQEALDHLLGSLRMLASLDWNEYFPRVSRTEQTLRRDPSGIYPRMEEKSRAQVRERLTDFARACGMDEATIAQLALDAAQEADGIRQNICWWLHTDEGAKAFFQKYRLRAHIRPLIPDPHGRMYLSCRLLLTALFFAAARIVSCSAAALIALPLLSGASAALVNRLIPLLIRPRPLLRLRLDRIPDDCRTLTVLPALLSSPGRAQALAEELETLGAAQTDENLSFLLLGDLPGHIDPHHPDDPEIIRAAGEAMAAANARAGREKYYFLHRERAFQRCEGRYMGRERKRGALNDLNRLLLHGENAFAQPSACKLTGQFAFLFTLDAGTRMLPGTLHRLIGTLVHPTNRLHTNPDGSLSGYALLAPRMELPADAVSNRFIALMGGHGGLDSYPTAVSDALQDLCGCGAYGGKGIYDIAAFDRAVSGRLPDNLILSHDLIEGVLARTASLCDLPLFEDHPGTVKSYLLRLNRWTRGDWQLIPLLLRPSIKLRAVDRFRLMDNLIRSLQAPTALLLLFSGFYTLTGANLILALSPIWLSLLFNPHWTKDTLMRIILRIALLPHEAAALLSAIIRSLWRMTISHRRLLQWVPSDDAERIGGALSSLPGRMAALLLLPSLLSPAPYLPLNVLLAGLWWTSVSFFSSMEQPLTAPLPIPFEDRSLLHDLAERTFRFFVRHVSASGLPPDNVQLDPPVGTARRTSPTDVGLYLAACVSARALGIISSEELAARAGQTLNSLEEMEKWRGHLYNWIDTQTLHPMHPKYVSSVDSGNLAACLLLTARSLEKEGAFEPARRMEALARGMDFHSLFDPQKKLFFIGYDAETDQPDAAHYDLMASESRILSFTAMMLHQVPTDHWFRLGRPIVRTDAGTALASWSGTMFEYLMPALFMPLFPGTLLNQTVHSAVDAQEGHRIGSDSENMPWGISESGYYAFDSTLNYQYRAFGLNALALRCDAEEPVCAPYASMLALPFAPEAVMENLRRMIDAGLMDEFGLFEAADCSPLRVPGGGMRIVKSHMAHHQGMILCAVCNALTDHSLVRLFMDRPEARALSLLLQEKPASCAAALPASASPPHSSCTH